MHWEILIIPLIALGVWIVGTLFKSEDDKNKKGVRNRGVPSGRAPGRRPVSALDRFLEEARRRREAVEQPPKPPPAPPPQPRRTETRPTRRQEAPRVAAPGLPKPEVAVAIPVAQPARPPMDVEPVASRLRPAERTTPPSPSPAGPRTEPALQQVRSLLSKPQTAATAFVLREIFDRPLCQRRR